MTTPSEASYLDAGILIGYLLLSLGIGLIANKILKSSTKNEEGFFLAGRKMPGWLNGISFAVTAMNADVAPAYVGMAVVVGLPVCWFYMSRFGIGVLLAGLLFYARWRNLGVQTGPEFFALRFGGKGAGFVRMYTASFSVVFGMIPWIGAGLLGVHMIFSPFFGIEDKLVTLMILLPVLFVYVSISGFAGVLITDFVQTIVILLSSLILCGMVLFEFGGPSGLAENLMLARPEKFPEILSVIPQSGHRVLGPLMIFGWFIITTLGFGGNVSFEGQRVISCKSTKEAVKVSLWGQIMLFAMLLLITLPALGAIINHPELYDAGPAEREAVYGMMISEFLPVGFRGIALAALAAAVMSTISSHLSYGSQTIVNDVLHPLFKGISSARGVWLGRGVMFFMLAASVVVVYHSKSLVDIAITVSGLFGSIALLGWAQWWWWRINIRSWLSANIFGPVIYFGLGYILTNFEWWQGQIAKGETVQQQMGILQALIALVLNTSLWILVTLLTKPEDMNILKSFYLKANPMGYWAPVRKCLEKEGHRFERPKGLMAGGLGATLVGFVWICLLVMAISKLYVGEYVVASIMLVSSAGIAYLFKKLFNWHVDRLEIPHIADLDDD